MAFNHRSLFSDPANINIFGVVCDSFCDQNLNTEGYCPDPCFARCPLVCHHHIPSFDPSPTPPTTTFSPHPPNKSQNLHLLLLISLSVLATACFLFSCYTLYKYYKSWNESRNRRRRSPQPQQEEDTHDQFLDQDQGPMLDHHIWFIRTVGLQPSVINTISICKYKRGGGLVEGTDCSVCLNEFQEDESLRLLPKCSHAFHIPCIDTWLRSHTNCPLCRAGIVANTVEFPTPVPPQRVGDPTSVREENQAVVSGGSGEFGREREDGDGELRISRIEEESENDVENGGKSPETSNDEELVQPMRRSVSLDSLAASMISVAIANSHAEGIAGNSDSQLEKPSESNMGIVPKKVDVNQSLFRLVGGSSFGRSLQKGPISMKRSLSCSGKVLFSRYARGRNSILPL